MMDLEKLLNWSENACVEFKAAQGGIPSSIWDTYSSFGNTFGGTIILGVGEDKKSKKLSILGVQDSSKMLKDFWNIVNNSNKVSKNILLERNVYVQKYDGKDLIVIEVPRANRTSKPIYVGTNMFKGTYRRNYEGDYLCDEYEIKAMLRDSSETSSDSVILDNIGLDSLNLESVKSYRSRFSIIRSNHVWNSLSDDAFLIKIGAARISQYDGKVHPTLAGLIFFGDFIAITDELPYFFLDYREKTSLDTRWADRVCSSDGDWSGNVYDFYFRVVDRITSSVKRPFVLDDSLIRQDDTNIHRALREALANSLIHADYYGRRGIVIEKEYERVTFSNPGIFRISLDDAIAGGVSDARNPRIFNMFSLINVGERSGTGLCDIYSYFKQSGLSEPIIKESIEPDRISLTLNINGDDAYAVKDSMSDSFYIVDEASSLKDMVYKCIYDNNYINTKEIANCLNVSTRTIQRVIKKLEDDGLIKNVGNRKSIKWIILKQNR